jgi:hypothetical protein
MEFSVSNICYDRCEKSVIIGHNRSSNPAGAPKTRVGGGNRPGSLVGFRSCAAPQVKWRRRVLHRRMLQKTGAKCCMVRSAETAGARRARMRRTEARQNRICRAPGEWRMTRAALGLAMKCDGGATEICRAASRREAWIVASEGRSGGGAHHFSPNLMRFGARAVGDREKAGRGGAKLSAGFIEGNHGREGRLFGQAVSEVHRPSRPIMPMSDVGLTI